jgi:hypothetical protein
MIRTREDISLALRASVESGGLLLDETDLGAEFFDPETGLAREVVRRFTSYRARLAVVVADPSARNPEFAEMLHEYRAHVAVRFFVSHQLARQWLAQMPGKKC